MNIDKKILDRFHWYEDEQGNIIDISEDGIPTNNELVRNGYGITYHSCFPLEITEHIDSYCWRPKTKLQKFLCRFRPLYKILEKKHHAEKTYHRICDCNSHIGGGTQDVIISMVNSGDYTLGQALMLWSHSCERCMNVLAYKYLNGADGYEEFSDEWKKCNTVCKFCESEDRG